MYKILINIITKNKDKWIFYQEDGADYVASSLDDIKDKALELLDEYGEDNVKIVDQRSGDDSKKDIPTYLFGNGTGGTSDYNELENKPKINGVELINNKSLKDLGIIIPSNEDFTLEGLGEKSYDSLDDKPKIPKKVSELENDSKYETVENTDTKIAGAKSYADEAIAHLVGSAPETLDTLEEVAKAIQDNETVVDALNAAIGSKADKTELETKQDKLTAGDGIKIKDNVISADNNVEFFYNFTTVEAMQKVIDAMRIGKKAMLISKGNNTANKGPGMFEDPIFYSPDVSNIDWDTYSGALYFKSDWWMDSYVNVFHGNEINLIPKWQYITVSISPGGIVESVRTNNWETHNNVGNVVSSLNVLGKTNEVEYTPTKDYHPATKLYVDNEIDVVAQNIYLPQELVDKGFDYHTGETIEVSTTVENISTDYGFALNDAGYYESNNQKKGSTWALCKIVFNAPQACILTIPYISSGESNYDYGIFGQVDVELANDVTDDGATDSVKVKLNCKGQASTEVKEITYDMPAGEHFIEIKYRKDGGGDQGNDSLQFKIDSPFIADAGIFVNKKMATTDYVDSKSNTKIGNEQLVFAKSFDYGLYPGASSLFYSSGCIDAAVCAYFSEILTKMYEASPSDAINTMGGTLLLTFPGAAKNGLTLCLYYYGGTSSFIGVGRSSKDSFDIKQYKLSFSFNNDSVNKTITVSKAIIEESQLTSNTPTTDKSVANKKYVDDNIKSYSAGDNITISDDNVISAEGGISNFAQIYIDTTIFDGSSFINNAIYDSNMINAILSVTKNGTEKGRIVLIHQYGMCTLWVSKTGTSGSLDVYSIRGTNYFMQYSGDSSDYVFFSADCSIDPTTNSYQNASIHYDTQCTLEELTSTPKSYTGYDATKTQVLKNVNGTLSWEDDQIGSINTVLATLTTVTEESDT